jgi:hypothetical protein
MANCHASVGGPHHALDLFLASLNGNGIGPEGAGHLAGALAKNRGLETFSIGDNPLRCEGRRAITLAINANPMSQLKEYVGIFAIILFRLR